MEYCNAPNYFQYRLENQLKQFDDEIILKQHTKDILTALKTIHSHGVVHCDIKPENFLFFKDTDLEQETNEEEDEEDEEGIVKLTDFGFSQIISSGKNKTFIKNSLGSFGYSAPEKKAETYIDQAVDMWAFGVCLYQMAVAYKPTSIKNYKYGSGPIPFIGNHWKKFNFVHLKDLIESCLKMKPEERITAEDALNHPWFET